MHDIEPYHNWIKFYDSSADNKSPFFGKEYNYELFSETIYGYFINPAWDQIGSETLYVKILYANYKIGFVVIELIGEWNDTLHNDVMLLKRNLIDLLIERKIFKFVLIGENVFNFHGSDDCYYEEWFDDVPEGYIIFLGFRDFIQREWRKFGIDSYANYGGSLQIDNWRTMTPQTFFEIIDKEIIKRLT